jgi:hypothetical protein
MPGDLERDFRMRCRELAVATIALSFVSAYASAATMHVIQGKVLVNTGGGYQPVQGEAQVSAGDMVMAGPGGLAGISYVSGCYVKVQPGEVVTVQPEDRCSCNGGLKDQVAVRGGLKDQECVIAGPDLPPFGLLAVAGGEITVVLTGCGTISWCSPSP